MLCFVFGGGLLLAGAVDVAWTTLGTHGGGPISAPVTAGVWKVALAGFRRWPNHRALSFVGSVELIILLVLWLGLAWGGWFLIFSATPGAIVDAHTKGPADEISRLYFTAYAISTMGNGDFVPSSSLWRVLTAFATLSGLGTLTMAITFLMNVLPAVVQTRQLGAYISDLGGTPQKIISRSWTGEQFDSLTDHLIQLTMMVHLYIEQHLAYPLLHYFHSEQERTASTLRLAALVELLLLVRCGVVQSARLPPMVMLPLTDAIEALRDVISSEFVEPNDEVPPLPGLSILRDLGIPTVDDFTYRLAAKEFDDTRRFFGGLLRDDGWPWEKVSA